MPHVLLQANGLTHKYARISWLRAKIEKSRWLLVYSLLTLRLRISREKFRSRDPRKQKSYGALIRLIYENRELS